MSCEVQMCSFAGSLNCWWNCPAHENRDWYSSFVLYASQLMNKITLAFEFKAVKHILRLFDRKFQRKGLHNKRKHRKHFKLGQSTFLLHKGNALVFALNLAENVFWAGLGDTTFPAIFMLRPTFCRGRRANLNLGCFLFNCPRGKNGFLLSLKRKTNINAHHQKATHRYINIP